VATPRHRPPLLTINEDATRVTRPRPCESPNNIDETSQNQGVFCTSAGYCARLDFQFGDEVLTIQRYLGT